MMYHMRRLTCVMVLSCCYYMGCNQSRNRQSNEPSKEPSRPQTALRVPREQPAIVPALEETIFITTDTVLVFPGHLEDAEANETDNGDRAPRITQDGGESWQEITRRTIKFDCVSFNDPMLGWLVREGSELWKTTDGGASWGFVSNVEGDEVSLDYSLKIKFTDDLKGSILSLDSLWLTQDGGHTWLRHEFPSVVSNFFVRGNIIWVASQHQSEENNGIYKTRDRGDSWDKVEVPHTMPGLLDSVDTQDVFLSSEQTAWLADTRGILRTDDGGSTWRKQRLPANTTIKSLCFINNQEGWASGWTRVGKENDISEAILLHTLNGGETWLKLAVDVKETSFDKVYFGDAQSGWLVSSGEAFGSASLYRTRDGGTRWTRVLSVKSPYASAGESEQ